MKWLLIFVLFAGCRSVSDRVPGVYVRSSTNVYGVEYDTLHVALVNSATDEFTITRRWRYIRAGNDTSYKVQRSFARFYPFGFRLHDAVRGKDYILDLRAGTLCDGEVFYHR